MRKFVATSLFLALSACVAPLGDLTIRWTGSDDGDVDVRDEYDDHDDEVVVVEEGPGDSGEVLAEAEVFVEAEEIES